MVNSRKYIIAVDPDADKSGVAVLNTEKRDFVFVGSLSFVDTINKIRDYQDYQWKHEPCLYGWKSGAGHAWYGDRKQTTVINFDKPQRNGEHPTMKPVGLFGYLMQNSSKEGDIILDSFGGSGTTIIAM